MLEINRKALALSEVIRNKASLKLASLISVLVQSDSNEALSKSKNK